MDTRHPLQVVTPTLDGDVLAHLALTDAAFTPGQLALLLQKGSVEGVRKVLNRLTTQGIVTATRIGRAAVAYELNRDHLAAAAVLQLADPTQALLARLEAELGSWEQPPVYASVFGSWARGTATVESDVDVFLVRPSDSHEDDWAAPVAALQHRVTRWTGNDARPFVVGEAEMIEMATEPVLRAIRTEGLTVFGDAEWLRTRVKPRLLRKAKATV